MGTLIAADQHWAIWAVLLGAASFGLWAERMMRPKAGTSTATGNLLVADSALGSVQLFDLGGSAMGLVATDDDVDVLGLGLGLGRPIGEHPLRGLAVGLLGTNHTARDEVDAADQKIVPSARIPQIRENPAKRQTLFAPHLSQGFEHGRGGEHPLSLASEALDQLLGAVEAGVEFGQHAAAALLARVVELARRAEVLDLEAAA